jgi:hypothetical protein
MGGVIIDKQGRVFGTTAYGLNDYSVPAVFGFSFRAGRWRGEFVDYGGASFAPLFYYDGALYGTSNPSDSGGSVFQVKF